MNQYPGQNPYAPPQAPATNAAYGAAPYGPSSARVEGTLLVVANGSPLPAMCLKCGAPPTHWKPQKYQFTPAWARMLGWLGYIVFSKKSNFQIPLCEPHRAEWKKWNLVAGLSLIPGLLVWGIVTAAVGLDSDAGGVVFFGGMILFIVELLVVLLLRAKKIVMATKIDKTHSWLRGIHPSVLQFVGNPQAPAYGPPPQQYAQQPYGQAPQQPYPPQGWGGPGPR
jgi:hypothetical protein